MKFKAMPDAALPKQGQRAWIRLIDACEKNDVAEAQAALAAGANPLAFFSWRADEFIADNRGSRVDGRTALHLAARSGALDCVKLLVEKCDVNAADRFGDTAASLAIYKKNVDCVQFLAPISDLSQTNAFNETPLVVAANVGHVESLRALIPFCDFASEGGSGRGAFGAAAASGRVECLRELSGACDVFEVDEHGHNAAMDAAETGGAECLRQVLESFDQKNPHFDLDSVRARHQGKTTLMFAVDQEDAECVKMLLPRVDANAIDSNGRTAMMRCVADGALEMAELLAKSTDLSIKDSQGLNALDIAVEEGRPHLASWLLPRMGKDALRAQTPHVFERALDWANRSEGLGEPSRWAVMDALASLATPEQIERVAKILEVYDYRKDNAPHCAALIEAQEIQKAAKGSARDSASARPAKAKTSFRL